MGAFLPDSGLAATLGWGRSILSVAGRRLGHTGAAGACVSSSSEGVDLARNLSEQLVTLEILRSTSPYEDSPQAQCRRGATVLSHGAALASEKLYDVETSPFVLEVKTAVGQSRRFRCVEGATDLPNPDMIKEVVWPCNKLEFK
jgi:hypothetical protein